MPVRKTQTGRWACDNHVYAVFPTRREAERFRAALAAAVAGIRQRGSARPVCCSIRDRIEEFIRDRREGVGRLPCNDRTAALYRKKLLAFDRAFHSKPLDAISKAEVKAWRNRSRRESRGGVRVSRDTVNKDIDKLKTFARWAQGNDYAPDALPLLTVQKLWERGKIGGMNRKPPRFVEIHRIFAAIVRIKTVRADVGLVLEGMLLYWLRPKSAWRLRRRDASLPSRGMPGKLRIEEIKGKHFRTAAIEPGSAGEAWARECLSMGKGKGMDAPLLICKGGRSRENPFGWTTASLDRAVAAVCRALKFDFRFNPYQIRHSAVAWAHKHRDLNLANVQAAMGHSKVTTQALY